MPTSVRSGAPTGPLLLRPAPQGGRTGPPDRRARSDAGSPPAPRPDPTGFAALLPPSAVSAETFRDLLYGEAVFPEEEAVVRGAVEARRREFRTVRQCARRALGGLGVPPVPVLPGPRREPQWPPGVVGSMTHCAGYRAAAVAYGGDVLSLGIDAEPHEALPEGMLPAVAGPEEAERLDLLYARLPQVHWDRVTFSAKESVYKAWFPLARRWLGFHDASLILDPDRESFEVVLHRTHEHSDGRLLDSMSGRWSVADDLIRTAVVVPPL
ncbi:4'-phosphopantetheinyl transferase superfamily protein [Streptomyces sp. NPDC097619]|uniref:4'-phosphopantetheinyl transferase family protein n=1 Tax=Streptomyces sp. NPDC097619 TaxID=3157228 RepID=UPI00333246D2